MENGVTNGVLTIQVQKVRQNIIMEAQIFSSMEQPASFEQIVVPHWWVIRTENGCKSTLFTVPEPGTSGDMFGSTGNK